MNFDLLAILPIMIVSAGLVGLMLLIGFVRHHLLSQVVTVATFALAIGSMLIAKDHQGMVTSLLSIGIFSLTYQSLILGAGLVIGLMAYPYLQHWNMKRIFREEFYLLMLCAVLGAMVLVSAAHCASLFLGLEILSISLFAMVAYPVRQKQTLEAGIKYLLLSSLASAFILFGMALIYAELGSLSFVEWAMKVQDNQTTMVLLGLALMIVGSGFKLSLAPFHLWTPEVYQGAPTPVTAFMATIAKAAVFLVMYRLVTAIKIEQFSTVVLALTTLGVLSMLIGNLQALFQNNIKRILGFSSVAHLGYLLLTWLGTSNQGTIAAPEAIGIYWVAYFVTSLALFGILSMLKSHNSEEVQTLEDIRGLFWRQPWLATGMTVALLSLAGIPPTSGFLAKVYVIILGVGSKQWLLVGALVIGSAIGLFYYLRIIIMMYQQPKSSDSAENTILIHSNVGLNIALVILVILSGLMIAFASPLGDFFATVKP